MNLIKSFEEFEKQIKPGDIIKCYCHSTSDDGFSLEIVLHINKKEKCYTCLVVCYSDIMKMDRFRSAEFSVYESCPIEKVI